MTDSCPVLPGSTGHVPGRGNIETAEFFYLGEAPGESEVNWRVCSTCQWEGEGSSCGRCASETQPLPSPFVGKAGQLARRMLKNAGINPSRVYFTNVIKCRPEGNKYPTGKLREQAESFYREELHAELQSFSANEKARKVIICAGAQALRAITGYDDVAARRGSVLLAGEDYSVSPDLGWLPAVICTLHPSFVLRGFGGGNKGDDESAGVDYLQVTVADYIKANRIVATGQLRRPQSIWVELAGSDVPQFTWFPPKPAGEPLPHLTLDLEYKGNQIGLIGLGSGEDIHVVSANESTLGSLVKAIADAPRLVGHNLITADLPVLEANHMLESMESILPRVVDTEIVQHLLYPDMESGLDYWGSVVTDLPAWKSDEKWGPVYCGRDVYATDQLYEKGWAGLEALDMVRCLPIRQQLQCALLRMSQRGVKIASEKISDSKSLIQNSLDSIRGQLPFKNPNSNPEVHAFFEGYVRKWNGKMKVDKHALVDVISKHGEEPVGQVARLLLEHRELSKIEEMYLTPYEEAGSDGFIHSRFDVTKQGTGRISSAEPNLSQLPKRPGKAVGDLGKRLVRSLIIPRHPGWLIMEADWSQIELRLVALFADAQELQQQLATGVDIHHRNAQRYSINRDTGKVVTYSSLYKATPFEIARSNDIPIKEVEVSRNGFFADNPRIPLWWEQVVREVVANGGILNLPFGRIRRFNGKVADWEKAALATLPQGTCADMLAPCLVDVENETKKMEANVLFPAHDAMLIEYPPNEEKLLTELLHDTMERPWPELNGFRNPIEIKRGPSWAEVKAL